MSTRADRRARWLLGAGGALGVAAGVATSLGAPALPTAALPPAAIVSVEGTPVLREEWERAVSLLAGDRREPPEAGDRARVLERLVDETLLVHHALAQGLLARDRGVRDAVLRAMVESITADAASRPPPEAALRARWEQEGAAAGEAAARAGFDEARPRLEAQLVEEARAAALREYLAGLRSRARIERAGDAGR